MLRKRLKITAVFITLLGVFVIEVLTPLGYVEWVLYFIPFIAASRLVDHLQIHLLSVFIILLIVAGFFTSPEGPPLVALSNRFFGILAILLMTSVITERMRAEEEIRHLAHHDPLTGLPNRRLFTDLADLELARARRSGRKAGILYLDLDGFKGINDTFGHKAGDQLLKRVAARLRSQIRQADSVARVGGDEFNILLSDLNTIDEAAAIAGKIIAAFRQPYAVDGHELPVTISVGASVYPDDGPDIETLLRNADHAMYLAKKQGKNTFATLQREQ